MTTNNGKKNLKTLDELTGCGSGVGDWCGGRRFSVGSEPVLEEPGSRTFVIPTDELVVLAHGSSMRCVPTEGSNALSACTINQLQKSHLGIHVVRAFSTSPTRHSSHTHSITNFVLGWYQI
jgi:hypothetical protein